MEHDPARVACQRPGIELAIGEDNCPEPDVAVFDADYAPGQRFTSRCYLLAEIVSEPRNPSPRALDGEQLLLCLGKPIVAMVVCEEDGNLVACRRDLDFDHRSFKCCGALASPKSKHSPRPSPL